MSYTHCCTDTSALENNYIYLSHFVPVSCCTANVLGLFGLVFPKTLWGLQPPPHDVTGDCRCIAAGITRAGTPVTPPPPRFPLSEEVPPRRPENRPALTVHWSKGCPGAVQVGVLQWGGQKGDRPPTSRTLAGPQRRRFHIIGHHLPGEGPRGWVVPPGILWSLRRWCLCPLRVGRCLFPIRPLHRTIYIK